MINWHNRYSKILETNRSLFDPEYTILEVGSGLQGIALWLGRKVVCVEPEWTGVPNHWIEPVKADIGNLPFSDNSFDFVVCVDVFEHLPKQIRRIALNELIRVSRKRVILSCPCGNIALEGELAFADLLKKLEMAIPNWLQEHFEYGLPCLYDLICDILDSSYEFAITANENMLQHYAGLLADFFMPIAHHWNVTHAAKTVYEPPLGESYWDRYYSYILSIDKRGRSKLEPLLDLRAAKTTKNGPTAAIYAVTHDPNVIKDIGAVRYIYTGHAANAMKRGEIPAALVDGGYLPNDRWSELSAIYSIWKNGPFTDVVGFCHYRRFFNFGEGIQVERQKVIDPSMIEEAKNSFVCEDLWKRVRDGMIIVAKPIDLGGTTIFDQYCESHNTNDYLAMLNIVSEIFPSLVSFLAKDFYDTRLYANNMFVMNWQNFDQICSIWFKVLQTYCSRVEAKNDLLFQTRDVSFLSERLFNSLICYAKHLGAEIGEYPIFFVNYPLAQSVSAAAVLDGFSRSGSNDPLSERWMRLRKLQEEKAQLEEEIRHIKGSKSWQILQSLKRKPVLHNALRIVKRLLPNWDS